MNPAPRALFGVWGAGWRLATLRRARLRALPEPQAAFWLAAIQLVCLRLAVSYGAVQPPRRFNVDALQSDGCFALLALLAAWIVARALRRAATAWQLAALLLSAALYLYPASALAQAALAAGGFRTSGAHWLLAGGFAIWSVGVAERVAASVAPEEARERRLGLALCMVFVTALPGLVLTRGGFWETDDQARWQQHATRTPPLDAQAILIGQPARMERALAGLAAQRPGERDLYFVGFAGDASQDVFLRELYWARHHLADRFGASLRPLLLVNSRATVHTLPLATAETLELALAGVAERMDPAEDLLLLYLTSHGTETHALEITLEGLALKDLPAERLGTIVRGSGIPWRAVVISACYSGGFIAHLADEHTLVMTAARHDRSSFGCSDDQQMTYFGRALFEHALPRADSLAQAYELARRRVARWEARDGFTPSEPQLAPAAAVERRFRDWCAAWPAAALDGAVATRPRSDAAGQGEPSVGAH